MNYPEFFKRATGNLPYSYQCRLACGPQADPDIPSTVKEGGSCQSQLINIPTGLGKTAAVVLAWLWNRAHLESEKWPRRLVYCLPMRTLVEQTEAEVRKWLSVHGLLWDEKPANRKHQVGIHVLMGGEDSGEWDIYPEENAILIGTQDMLLSRALNRGYGMSRYRWPMHFGLVNNDCLWVMDETQLMGVGVETSAQLDGFRHDKRLGTFGACSTWWMSATLEEARLATVDRQRLQGETTTETLSATELNTGQPHKLITAIKKVAAAPIVLNATSKLSYAKQLAAFIKTSHLPDTLTLVVVNRVSRAREIFQALTAGKNPLYNPERVALIHSRFRPIDRERHTRLLFGKGDRIVIATQAVEAGVDVSARVLITELAPWTSLVQRIGRCNRRAEITDAKVFWVDIEPDPKGDLVLPYSTEEIAQARGAISPLDDASPRRLGEVTVKTRSMIRPVIRRRDLLDLFDTTPDICGQDLDVSRYIRDGDDNDVQFYWRVLTGAAPDDNESSSHRDELCRVSIGDAAKFLDKKLKTTRAWQWDPLIRKWEESKIARPGGVYLVDVQSGGYSDSIGWTGDPSDQPTPRTLLDGAIEFYEGDPLTFLNDWQSLEEHTKLVVLKTSQLASMLLREHELITALKTAAWWHDVGKAHEEFQKMLLNGDVNRNGILWAKSAHKNGRCGRHGFRHELASALAWLMGGPVDGVERDLIAYLIAAHHGKVRLSIRSLPNETGNPKAPDAFFARGIWDGDKIPEIKFEEFTAPEVSIDLSFMQMGEGQQGISWLGRTVALRDRFGAFRLALLETLLRAADARASREKPTKQF